MSRYFIKPFDCFRIPNEIYNKTGKFPSQKEMWKLAMRDPAYLSINVGLFILLILAVITK